MIIGPARIGTSGCLGMKSLDVVQHVSGRRGILLEALQDGEAFVLFRDNCEIELVGWRSICKVPEAENRSMG